MVGIDNGTVRKNVETETYAREKSWSIFIVATPAPPLAVTRETPPASDGSHFPQLPTFPSIPIYIYRYISPWILLFPQDSPRKISAVKMTNFIMPWIPHGNSFDSLFSLATFAQVYISRKFLAILFLANFGI